MTDQQKKTKQNKKPRRGHGEGAIYWREDRERWIAELPLDHGKNKYFTGKTYAEAQRKLNHAKLEQQQGKLASGPKQTVKDFLNYWFEEVHKFTIRISTQALYRRHMDNHIIPALGHIQLQKLTVDQVQAFLNSMGREGLKAGTIQTIFGILNTALRDAVQWKRIPLNVCTAVKLPRRTRRKVYLLDQEQAKKFIRVIEGSQIDCIIVLALTSAMRLGEILALRWEDIDFEGKVLQIRHTVDYIKGHGWVESEPKSESGRRSIRLAHLTVEALKEHRARQSEARLKAGETWKERGLVFPNTIGGFFRRRKLQAAFKELLREAGLPDMHFHDLRHNAATLLLSKGIPMKTVQEILGHANITTTMNIYGHIFPSTHEDAMNEIDDWFGYEDTDTPAEDD